MTTGKKIRTRRKELGMTVDELAAKVGKNRATIYRYESDAIEMPASMVKPLADALDTIPEDLMDWDMILRDIASHEKKMDSVLPQIKHGVSVAGGNRSYVLFKALNRGGHLAHDLQSILSVLYSLNSAGCNTEMHSIRILTEVASMLDMTSLEHLVSYAEFLDNRNQKRIGESYQHPYQPEQADALLQD